MSIRANVATPRAAMTSADPPRFGSLDAHTWALLLVAVLVIVALPLVFSGQVSGLGGHVDITEATSTAIGPTPTDAIATSSDLIAGSSAGIGHSTLQSPAAERTHVADVRRTSGDGVPSEADPIQPWLPEPSAAPGGDEIPDDRVAAPVLDREIGDVGPQWGDADGDAGHLDEIPGILPGDGDDRRGATDVTPDDLAIVRLADRTDGTDQGVCSGTLISEHHVLTAAHCLYNHGEPWEGLHPNLSTLAAEPGVYYSDDSDVPVRPRHFAGIEEVDVHPRWVDDRLPGFDVAVVTLDRPLGAEVGYWSYYAGTAHGEEDFYETDRTHVHGYPVDSHEDLATTADGHLVGGTGAGLGTSCISDAPTCEWSPMHDVGVDLTRGQSGGPVWVEYDGEPTIVSVATVTEGGPYAEREHNWGTRITPEVASYIEAWTNDTASATRQVDLRDGTAYDYWPDGAKLNKYNVNSGGAVTFEHAVHNVGTATATDVEVGYYLSADGSPDPATDVELERTTIDTIAPFDRATVTVTTTVPVSPGEYTVYRVLDPDDTIEEYDGDAQRVHVYEQSLRVVGHQLFD